MKKLRRILSFVTTLALMSTLSVLPAGAATSDYSSIISGHWTGTSIPTETQIACNIGAYKGVTIGSNDLVHQYVPGGSYSTADKNNIGYIKATATCSVCGATIDGYMKVAIPQFLKGDYLVPSGRLTTTSYSQLVCYSNVAFAGLQPVSLDNKFNPTYVGFKVSFGESATIINRSSTTITHCSTLTALYNASQPGGMATKVYTGYYGYDSDNKIIYFPTLRMSSEPMVKYGLATFYDNTSMEITAPWLTKVGTDEWYPTDTGTKSFIFENVNFTSFPAYISEYVKNVSNSSGAAVVFRNCKFSSISFTSLNNVYFEGCSGSILLASDNLPIDDGVLDGGNSNTSLTVDKTVAYNSGTLTPAQLMSRARWKYNLNGHPNRSSWANLNLNGVSGGGNSTGYIFTSGQTDVTLGTGNNMWLQVANWPSLTSLASKTGTYIVNNAVANAVSISNCNARVGLTSTKGITASGGTLTDGTALKTTAGPLSLNSLKTTGTVSATTTGSASPLTLAFVESANINLTTSTASASIDNLTSTGTTNITLNNSGTMSKCNLNVLNLNFKTDGVELSRVNTSGKVTVTSSSYNSVLNVTGCNVKDGGIVANTTTAVQVNSGSFTGSPGMSLPNSNIVRATITDLSGASVFTPDIDSKVTTGDDGKGHTTYTVDLINPPIIIDWENFPKIEIDMSAPTIEIIRNPASVNEPCKSVTITAKATDPNGTKSKISINGGDFSAPAAVAQASCTVTENQVISIIAVDENGNNRDYQVSVKNIDVGGPTISRIVQSTDEWVKAGGTSSVKITVDAFDDQKLSASPYYFKFTAYGSSTSVNSGWTANNFYSVNKPGKLEITVKDYLNQSVTETYYVNNIDGTPPTATWVISPESTSVDEGATISVNINNVELQDIGNASPLNSNPICWEDFGWSNDLTRVVRSNGTYRFRVRDSVGNIGPSATGWYEVSVQNIVGESDSDLPYVVLSSSSNPDGGGVSTWVKPPVTLTATPYAGTTPSAAPLHNRPISWDDGKTWTSLSGGKSTKIIRENGTYDVLVRDSLGNTSESQIVVTNIDADEPIVNLYLFKAAPAEWDYAEGNPEVEDLVWKIGVDAYDLTSSIDVVRTMWDNGTHTDNNETISQYIEEPGVYGVWVYDKAGNAVYAEKVVTAEALGQSTGTAGSNNVVGVAVPESGSAGGGFTSGAFNGVTSISVGDLVYGYKGAYHKQSGSFSSYKNGCEGISIDLIAHSKNGRTLTGYVQFNGIEYDITFNGTSETKADGGRSVSAHALIPRDAFTTDMRNGRLFIVFREWKDDDCRELVREGSVTMYASVQASSPTINYQYSRASKELVVTSNSTVAGVKSLQYKIGSGTLNDYTGPIDTSGATTIVIQAFDNVNNESTITLDAATLPISGSGGGSLPTEELRADGVNVYYIAGRNSESFIIGGTRSNSDSVPSSEVFNALTGAA